MGLLGRWIDRRTDEERDRIVEAQEWCRRHVLRRDDDGTVRRCLMGHAFGTQAGALHGDEYRRARLSPEIRRTAGDVFDKLTDRFGLPRIVKACKQRAGHRSPVPEPREVAKRSGPGAWPALTVNPNEKARA